MTGFSCFYIFSPKFKNISTLTLLNLDKNIGIALNAKFTVLVKHTILPNVPTKTFIR